MFLWITRKAHVQFQCDASIYCEILCDGRGTEEKIMTDKILAH